MNIKKKVKVVLGTFSTFTLTAGVLIGLASPAIAPSKAEAQVLIQKKYQNFSKFQPKELVEQIGRAHV